MSDPTPPPATTVSDDKKARERSPSYPAISLEKAVELATKFWDQDKRQAAFVARAATNLGFGAKSSNGLLAIAAMKKYGFLDDEGSGPMRKVKLTDVGIAVVNPSNPNRGVMLKEAALRPSIHQHLWETFVKEGASDGTIHDHLVFQRKFTEDAANALISQFKDTVEFAKLRESDKVREDSNDQSSTDSIPVPSNPGLELQKEKERAGGYVPPVDAFKKPPTPPPAGLMDFPVPLPSGVVAYYRLPTDLSEADFNFYHTLLTAYKPGLVKGSSAPQAQTQPATKTPSKILERTYPASAVWKNKDNDMPVIIVGIAGSQDGQLYYKTSTKTGIPASELTFDDEAKAGSESNLFV